jgi:hypothetical protein
MPTRLKSRNSPFPPHGFQFFQPQIPKGTYSAMLGFDIVVNEIIALRKANPRFGLATDKATVGDELDAFNAKRLESMPGGDAYIIDDTGGPPPKFKARSLPTPQSARGAVSAGIKSVGPGLKRLEVGIGVWMDWLGRGLAPVDHDLAEKRAAICAVCPLNQKPSTPLQWIYSKAKYPISAFMQIKNDRDIKTSLDAKLFNCQACDCVLALKVHCPLDVILEREKPEHLARLDPRCWILKEKETNL